MGAYKHLEEALKRRADQKGYTGDRKKRYVYGTLNAVKQAKEQKKNG